MGAQCVHCHIPAKSYELQRDQIHLGEILGEGQFGDVHKGTFKSKDGNLVPVAVKTCKREADLNTTEKFLEEACMYIFLSRSSLLISNSRYNAEI